MIIKCPNCGEAVPVNGLGRKPLNITVKNICDALRDSLTVTEAAKVMGGCSRAYIYKTLKAQGMSPKSFTKGGHSVKELGGKG
jgi:hypothetical protein